MRASVENVLQLCNPSFTTSNIQPTEFLLRLSLWFQSHYLEEKNLYNSLICLFSGKAKTYLTSIVLTLSCLVASAAEHSTTALRDMGSNLNVEPVIFLTLFLSKRSTWHQFYLWWWLKWRIIGLQCWRSRVRLLPSNFFFLWEPTTLINSVSAHSDKGLWNWGRNSPSKNKNSHKST